MKKIFTILWLLFSLNAFSQTIYFVNDNATGANNGSSWTDAFTKLQDALTAAESGDQIWVAAGTYYPDEGGGLINNNRSYSFHLKNGVAIYGGFAGTEIQLGERNVSANVTTLSGEIQQDNDISNNAFHVVQSSSVNNTAVLDGFTITGGNANGSVPNSLGGGMYNESSSPSLINCSFSANTGFYGGGIMNSESSPTLTNCNFSGNTTGEGGGIFNNNGSSPTLTSCSFSGNTAQTGGGIFNTNFSNPTLTNCSFSGNTVVVGGGIFNESSSPILTNCSFSGNTAVVGGGIYNNFNSSPTLTNCILWGNTPGQIFNEEGSSVLVTYSIVQGGFPGTGNLDQDPLFVDAANGDLHLQAGSPAIDNGLNSANTTSVDLDGNPRVVNGIIDMGAFEFHVTSALVSSFTLINAAANKDLMELKDGDTINLAALPTKQLNIRANASVSNTRSVVFHLSGKRTYSRTENAIPYALFSDRDGDYSAATLQPGNYTLTATPYTNYFGGGTKGTPLTIHFHVLYQEVSSFTLVNANTDKDIRELKDGDVIDLATLDGIRLNIRADTTPAKVGSVVFEGSFGAQSGKRTENQPPYAVLGDGKGDYNGVVPAVGAYTLTATPYSGYRGTGQKGVAKSISIKVVNSSLNSITRGSDVQLKMERAEDFKVSVAPNPFSTTAKVFYQLPVDGVVSIRLFDAAGKEVATVVQGDRKAGVYSADLNAAGLSKGVYYYRAMVNSGKRIDTQTGMLMVVK